MIAFRKGLSYEMFLNNMIKLIDELIKTSNEDKLSIKEINEKNSEKVLNLLNVFLVDK